MICFKILSLLLLIQFIFINCENLKIYKNKLTAHLEQHLIGKALLISETEMDLNLLSKMVSDEMNNKFGKSWICLSGTNLSSFGLNFESINTYYIWFSFKELHYIVFNSVLLIIWLELLFVFLLLRSSFCSLKKAQILLGCLLILYPNWQRSHLSSPVISNHWNCLSFSLNINNELCCAWV